MNKINHEQNIIKGFDQLANEILNYIDNIGCYISMVARKIKARAHLYISQSERHSLYILLKKRYIVTGQEALYLVACLPPQGYMEGFHARVVASTPLGVVCLLPSSFVNVSLFFFSKFLCVISPLINVPCIKGFLSWAEVSCRTIPKSLVVRVESPWSSWHH